MLTFFLSFFFSYCIANSVTAQVRNEFSDSIVLSSATLSTGSMTCTNHKLISKPGMSLPRRILKLVRLTTPFGRRQVLLECKEELFTVSFSLVLSHVGSHPGWPRCSEVYFHQRRY
jgi:hypothetical protein